MENGFGQNMEMLTGRTGYPEQFGRMSQQSRTGQMNQAAGKSGKGMMIGMGVCGVLAVVGVAVGIFGVVSLNGARAEIAELETAITEKDAIIAESEEKIAEYEKVLGSQLLEELGDLSQKQRDVERKNAMAQLNAAILSWQGNNNGRVPADPADYDGEVNGQGDLVVQPTQGKELPATDDGNLAAKIITHYLNGYDGDENYFRDSDGWAYGLTILHNDYYEGIVQDGLTDHMIYFVQQAQCGVVDEVTADPLTAVVRGEKTRNYAIVYELESGVYCTDSRR